MVDFFQSMFNGPLFTAKHLRIKVNNNITTIQTLSACRTHKRHVKLIALLSHYSDKIKLTLYSQMSTVGRVNYDDEPTACAPMNTNVIL